MRLSLIVVINVSTDNLIMRVVRFIPLSFAFPSLSLSLRLEPSARVYFSVNGIDCIFWDLRSAIGKSVRLIFMESKGDKFFPLTGSLFAINIFFSIIQRMGRKIKVEKSIDIGLARRTMIILNLYTLGD